MESIPPIEPLSLVEDIYVKAREASEITDLNMREFSGIDKVLQSIHGELLNNTSKLIEINKHSKRDTKKLEKVENGANEPSLYSRNVVGILIKLIFLGVLLNIHNNIAFTWIFCTRNITIDNKAAVKKFLYLVIRYEKVYAYAHYFSALLFSFSEIHQFHHLDGCQAIGINFSLIFAFWALCF